MQRFTYKTVAMDCSDGVLSSSYIQIIKPLVNMNIIIVQTCKINRLINFSKGAI